MCPPLPHAWELEGWPGDEYIARVANFAGLLAWRVNLARIAGLCAAFPRRRLKYPAIRRSDLRSLDSAVQSRVGDGFLVCVSIQSRAEQVQPDSVARLPEHEVRDDCWGLKPTIGCAVPRKFCGAGVDENIATNLAANSHVGDRSGLVLRSAAYEKPVPANRVGKRLRENLRANSCPFAARRLGRHIPPRG